MFTVLKLARIRGEAIASLLFVLLFQTCYSAAPVYLSRVAASSPTHEQMYVAIAVFLVLYFLPFPLTYFAAMFRALWRTSARRAFYEDAYLLTCDRIPDITSPTAEKSFATVISATGQDLMSDCINFTYDTALLLLSSLLSVTLISLFVLPGFALAYLVSAVLCILILWWLGPWQVRMSQIHEKSYNRLVAALPQGWLANTLGEKRVVDRFMEIFARRWRQNRRIAFASMHAFRSFDLLQALGVWTPATVLLLTQARTMSVGQMIALAIVLPRLTEALLDVTNLVGNLADYLALRGRVGWLNKALSAPVGDLAQRFTMAGLKIRRCSPDGWRDVVSTSVDDVFANVRGPGRYAVSGPNGAGKTSLLLLLKLRAGGDALYLPAHAMLFPALPTGVSTGQRKLRDLRQAIAMARKNVTMLLLDEWDANLDPQNRRKMSELLDEISRTHAVIEVSHRAGEAGPANLTS